jgi:hypothetical protein
VSNHQKIKHAITLLVARLTEKLENERWIIEGFAEREFNQSIFVDETLARLRAYLQDVALLNELERLDVNNWEDEQRHDESQARWEQYKAEQAERENIFERRAMMLDGEEVQVVMLNQFGFVYIHPTNGRCSRFYSNMTAEDNERLRQLYLDSPHEIAVHGKQ